MTQLKKIFFVNRDVVFREDVFPFKNNEEGIQTIFQNSSTTSLHYNLYEDPAKA